METYFAAMIKNESKNVWQFLPLKIIKGHVLRRKLNGPKQIKSLVSSRFTFFAHISNGYRGNTSVSREQTQILRRLNLEPHISPIFHIDSINRIRKRILIMTPLDPRHAVREHVLSI